MTRKRVPCFFMLFVLLPAALQAQFARTYGGGGTEDNVRILTTPDDGFLVAGSSSSFNGTGPWLLKLAAGGSVEWERAYATAAYVGPFRSVCATADGGYDIAGGTFWVVRTNGLGVPVRQTYIPNIGPHGYYPFWICPGPDSGNYVIGYTMTGPDYDAWVVRLSSAGEIVWQKAFGLGAWEVGVCGAMTADGGLVAAASHSGDDGTGIALLVFKIDALGALVWQRSYSAPLVGLAGVKSICAAADGGFFLTGPGFLLKLGQDGAPVWARVYYDASFNDIGPTSDGGSIVAGDSMARSGDILVMKLGPDGGIEWQKSYGGPFVEFGLAAVATARGDYGVVGTTSSHGAGGWDLCLLRLPEGGDLGPCLFTLNSAATTEAAEVDVADIGLTVQDTSLVAQASPFVSENTSGRSETYGLCAARKLLTIITEPAGSRSWTAPSVGAHVYEAGRTVTLSATAQVTWDGETYSFSSWDGDVVTSENPTTVSMANDRSVRANYVWEWPDPDDGDDPFDTEQCFVATAAYRTPLHPAVKMLREFRDRRLLTNGVGRAFVAAYCRWSPPAARVIAGSPVLRFAARALLVPFIAVAFVVLKLGWVLTFLLSAALAYSALRLRNRGA